MSAADSYAASFAYFTGVPGFAANAKSDYATDAFARVQASNAQVEAALAGAALNARSNVRQSELALESQKSRNAADIKINELARKPTLAQKLQGLAQISGGFNGGGKSDERRAVAMALYNAAGNRGTGGIDRAGNQLNSAQVVAGAADVYGDPARTGIAKVASTVGGMSASPAPAFTPSPDPAPVTPTQQPATYGFTGAQAPQVSLGGEDAYRKFVESWLGGPKGS